MRKTALTVLGLSLLAAPAQGQIAWDGPLLVSPDTPPGWGLYLVDPEYNSGIGFLTTWRGGGPLGFRIGIAEDAGDDLAVYGGIDYSRRIVNYGNNFPLNISWVAGAGFGVGDDAVLSFPLGIVVGRAFQAETVMFNPSIAPRLVLDAWLGDDNRPRDDDDLNLGLALDFGLDIGFDPGWAIRFGVSGGDREALAIGISFQVL